MDVTGIANRVADRIADGMQPIFALSGNPATFRQHFVDELARSIAVELHMEIHKQ